MLPNARRITAGNGEGMLSFEVELGKVPGARLGMDLVLVSSPLGNALVVERVGDGIVESWNRRSIDPYKIRPGDFIARCNGVEGNISALAAELRSGKDLRITIERASPEDAPQVWQSLQAARWLQQQQQPAQGLPAAPVLAQAGFGLGGMNAIPPALDLAPGLLAPPVMPPTGLSHLESALGGIPRIPQAAPAPLRGYGVGPGIGGLPAGLGAGLNPAFAAGLGAGLGAGIGPGIGGLGLGVQAAWAGNTFPTAPFPERAPPGVHLPSMYTGLAGADFLARAAAQDSQLVNDLGRSTFEVVLHKPVGAHLGVDVLTGTDFVGLSVQRVTKGGVVEAWNMYCDEQHIIKPGDTIVRVNGAMGDAALMMEEMRTRAELRITLVTNVQGPIQATPKKQPSACQQVPQIPAVRNRQNPTQDMKTDTLPTGASKVVGSSRKANVDLEQSASAHGSDGSIGDGKFFVFNVEIDKPPGAKMGIDVMLVTGYGTCGLVVESVAEGGCVDLWNKRSQFPKTVMPGDCIIAANGVSSLQDLARTAEEFASDGPKIRFTLQRSPQGSAAQHQRFQQLNQQLQFSDQSSWPVTAQQAVGTPPGLEQQNVSPAFKPAPKVAATSSKNKSNQAINKSDGQSPQLVPPGLLLPESRLTASGLAESTVKDKSQSKSTAVPPSIPAPPPPSSAQTQGDTGIASKTNLAALSSGNDSLQGDSSSLPPAKLLLNTLRLDDAELTTLLRASLKTRPWLVSPVRDALSQQPAAEVAEVAA